MKMYEHIKKAERLEIAILLKKGYSKRDTAQALQRSHSSIVREIKKNSAADIYDPHKAQHKAYVKRKYSKYQGMKAETIKKLQSLFEKYPEIKLVYLFGSQARGDAGPLSDYDFAAYIDGKDVAQTFNLKILLIGEISMIVGSDEVDLVTLNTADDLLLKYEIIREGKVIYEQEPFRILVEPQILNEYFDFHTMLARNGLTKVLP